MNGVTKSKTQLPEVEATQQRQVAMDKGDSTDPYCPLLTAVLRAKGLSLRPQYTTSDAAQIFGCTSRVIQERIQDGRWWARDLPGRGRFLSSDLEAFLGMLRPAKIGTPKKMGRK